MRIAFQSARNASIYKMNADGSRVRRLTPNPNFETTGTISDSPDWGVRP